MTGSPTTPPPHEHPIDPVSERLGELRADVRGIRERLGGIEGRLTGIETRLETFATKAELRVWGSLLVVMLGALFALVLGRGA